MKHLSKNNYWTGSLKLAPKLYRVNLSPSEGYQKVN